MNWSENNVLYSQFKQNQWQLVHNYIFVFSNFFDAYVNGIVIRSENFTHSKNFIEYQDTESITLNESYWYIRSKQNDFDLDLNDTNRQNIKDADVLLPAWKSFLNDELYPNGTVETGYLNKEEDGVQVNYPAEFKEFYLNWDETEAEWKYFPGSDPPMPDYDPRCRPFYELSIDNTPNTTLYGPYFNPGNETNFYAATISKPVLK